MKIKLLTTLVFFIITQNIVLSQPENVDHGKGLKYMSKDSSYSIKFNTRFQSLYEAKIDTETDDWSDKLMIRRYRLKFGGFLYNPKFEYKIELSLSNRDQKVAAKNTNDGANIVLDAVLKWHFAKDWQLWFGQTKLPGNRERVISSQQLQFVDRSNLNSRYTIDRDKGIQLRHKNKVGKGVFRQLGSISLGDGRNVIDSNSGGYDYTIRGEYLPFGTFKSKGDYFGADILREDAPKLSIGVSYDYNDGASKTRGQLGDYLESNSSLETVFVDLMFKYQGFSIMSEYANKKVASGSPFGIEYNSQTSSNPAGDVAFYYSGTGFNIATGYVFKSNFEIAARYTKVNPEYYNDNTQYTFGLSKYISKHTLKIQSDLTLIKENTKYDEIMFRVQMEIGF